MATVPKRLLKLTSDPWRGYWSCKQKLTIQRIRGAEGSRLVLGVRKVSAGGTEGSTPPIVDITVTRRRIRR